MPVEKSNATVARAPGLPKDGTEGDFFAVDESGDMWAIRWSAIHGGWQGVGWQNGWPASMLFRGDVARVIVSHITVPMHLIETAAG